MNPEDIIGALTLDAVNLRKRADALSEECKKLSSASEQWQRKQDQVQQLHATASEIEKIRDSHLAGVTDAKKEDDLQSLLEQEYKRQSSELYLNSRGWKLCDPARKLWYQSEAPSRAYSEEHAIRKQLVKDTVQLAYVLENVKGEGRDVLRGEVLLLMIEAFHDLLSQKYFVTSLAAGMKRAMNDEETRGAICTIRDAILALK